MDHESLRTAATYLNNLLLARGLLRNSTAIDFVKPSKESRAQIINLVHDLILREDGDREQREHVALTLRNLRADEARHVAEMQKLRDKADEGARVAESARAAERVAVAEARKVERAMKAVQEQVVRLKTNLAQVKTQCANDVRKRDLELARLKTHLQGQQRGSKTGVTAPSITITSRGRAALDASVHDVGDPEYSLKQETTEFLTQLSQSLSDENDSLISLVRGALGTMQELLGLPPTVRKHHDSAIGSMDGLEDKGSNDMLSTLPTSYETLATDMESCMENLKSILNNPNFVTVEEVEVREEEIVRLREGWERMEQRWKDVMYMMDGWRRRMDVGETINMDDLRRGIGLVSPQNQRHGQITNDPEQSFIDGDESVCQIQLPDEDVEGSSILPDPPQLSSPMIKSNSPKRKHDLLEPPKLFDLRPSGKPIHATSSKESPPVQEEADEVVAEDEEESEAQLTVAEKLSAAQAEAERAAAVAAAERADTPADADPSAVEALPRKKRTSRSRAPFAAGLDGAMDEMTEAAEGDDTLGVMHSPAKKSKMRGRPKRRKSTLSPEELEALLADD
ncbi:Hypothetical protein R9X50_00614600 [Acrodontium crateriforme]|uniref:NIMA interactive protein n=1 Tax=Acrodontium crateriforme TaxID=150365 RepID=A0AAQ3R9N5_9PEZI|nr:Hypothetical protein R9X50_00614600 [Acrodontium crateriforme]